MDINIENDNELVEYLASEGHITRGEHPETTTLTGGVSNRAVMLKKADGESWVIKQALSKLRVQAEWYSDPARIHREALGIQWLAEFTPEGTLPQLIFEDKTNHILGMTAVPFPHENWKEMLLRGELQTDHMIQFAQILAGIQSQSYAQQDAVKPVFQDREIFESLRIEPYYMYTVEQQPEAALFYEHLIKDIRQHVHTLVHGDYSPKNILVYRDQLILLDHEAIHFGDPTFDFGFSMTHLLSKAHHLRAIRSAFVDAAHIYWRTYQENTSTLSHLADMESRAVRHTLGCLLARIDGRSPLEYLTETERSAQRAAALTLMADPPSRMPDLINAFIQEIELP